MSHRSNERQMLIDKQLNKKITIIGDPSTKLSAASINEVADLLPAIVNDPTSINAKIVFEGQHATIGTFHSLVLSFLFPLSSYLHYSAYRFIRFIHVIFYPFSYCVFSQVI